MRDLPGAAESFSLMELPTFWHPDHGQVVMFYPRDRFDLPPTEENKSTHSIEEFA